MIYNTSDQSNDKTESQAWKEEKKKRPKLMLILKAVYSWNKMW